MRRPAAEIQPAVHQADAVSRHVEAVAPGGRLSQGRRLGHRKQPFQGVAGAALGKADIQISLGFFRCLAAGVPGGRPADKLFERRVPPVAFLGMPLEALDLAFSLHQLGVSENRFFSQQCVAFPKIHVIAVRGPVEGVPDQQFPDLFHVAELLVIRNRLGNLVLQFIVQRGALILAVDVVLGVQVAHLGKKRLTDDGKKSVFIFTAAHHHIGFPGNRFHHARRVVPSGHNPRHLLGEALKGRQVVHQLPFLLGESQNHIRQQNAFDVRPCFVDQGAQGSLAMLQPLLGQNVQPERPSPKRFKNQVNIRRQKLDAVLQEELNDLLLVKHHKRFVQLGNDTGRIQAVQHRRHLPPACQDGVLLSRQSRQQPRQLRFHGGGRAVYAVDHDQGFLLL